MSRFYRNLLSEIRSKNGMTIIVHSRSSTENAKTMAEKLTASALTDRARYVSKMT